MKFKNYNYVNSFLITLQYKKNKLIVLTIRYLLMPVLEILTTQVVVLTFMVTARYYLMSLITNRIGIAVVVIIRYHRNVVRNGYSNIWRLTEVIQRTMHGK